MRRIISCIWLGLLITLQASAISRIGKSSVGDKTEGFRAEVSESYVFQRPIGNGGVVLMQPTPAGAAEGDSPVSGMPSQLRLTRFRVEFSDLADLGRSELMERMRSSRPRWTPREMKSPCVVAYTYQSKQLNAAFATWGGGRGVVIATGPSRAEAQELVEILESLEIEPGACAWN